MGEGYQPAALKSLFQALLYERHGFCSQLIHISIPMKKLQLLLVSAFLCCVLTGQSQSERSVTASSGEAGLPFSFFTVTPLNGHAVLRWATAPVKSEDFFIVERSSDALHFEVLGAMDATTGKDSVFSMVDNSVLTGPVSYRIRITSKDGKEQISKTVNMNSVSEADFRFYPNPVDKLLIIRSSHALNVQVQDSYGVVLFTQEVDAGMQIVNVSSLQKGNYILKATDKSTNTVISEQLVKNN
jgi:Secretion system C-terminal sorting domain